MTGPALLTLVVLSAIAGTWIARTASPERHTVLTSGASAVRGIVLVGAVVVAGRATGGPALAAGLLATVLATANLVGGFVVTDRLLGAPAEPARGELP